MRLLTVFLAMAFVLGAMPQNEKPKEPFDPFADPAEELIKRAERSAKEKRFNELKAAASELKELSQMMSDEIEAGGKDVISVKMWTNLDRAEKLVKKARKAKLLSDKSDGTPSKKAVAEQLYSLAEYAQSKGWSAEDLLLRELKKREKGWRKKERSS